MGLSKEASCKIVGIFSAILGLILLIISAIYLSKIVYCKKHSGESAYKNPYPEFKPTFNKKPHSPDYESFGGNNLKFRHRRSPRPPEFSPGKFNKKGFSKELGYFDYRIFYISAICGIVFGILQLIGSGIYAGIVNKKNCKKCSMFWCGLQLLIKIGLIGIFIAMLSFNWDKYNEFHKQVYKHCLGLTTAFVAIVGLNFVVLLLLSVIVIWCCRSSKEYEHHDQQQQPPPSNEQTSLNRQ